MAVPRLVLTCFLCGGLVAGLLLGATPASPPLWHATDAAQAPPPLHQLNAALVSLAQQLLPAVVSLKVHLKDAKQALPPDHPAVPEAPRPFVTGSGFIIRADGLALTNYHVVEDATTIEVRLYDGRTTTATVIGRDPVGDIALLRLATEQPLPVAPLGSSAALQVGELVVAIGSPFGFDHTVTLGIVSAVARNFLRSGVVGGYIQTDASINTGNSGGPLVNMRGEVVGINTATVGRGELGFAIPIDAVKAVLPQLYTTGQVQRGWLGVQIRPLDADKARELGLAAPRGAYVHGVLEAQPAQRAGLLAGDVILRFDGQEVATPFDLQRLVAATPVGKTVQVEVWRKQARLTVSLTVGRMPEQR
ncbi:MAG: hypothetical protein KatS3mg131_1710 [Candidatus Tectimicrobiota bacterium]|nr:MAG: hypothetical protein KatS3mg131_1710 [Candidatus Tectomicrobia bacterium]